MRILHPLLLSSLILLTDVSAQPSRPLNVRAIANSFMRLHPDSITYADEAKSARWNYEQGLMMEAFFQAWKLTGDDFYLRYARTNLDHYVRPDGSINTFRADEFNIDNLTPGKFLVRMAQHTGELKYRKAIDTLMRQFLGHPRTKEGGFWHKQIYPHQMWLDGLYMGQPFRALYAAAYQKPELFDDITLQFILVGSHAKDPKTGLYYHGWDESRSQRWADSATGCSPNFWGRSIGWFSMALIDVLEFLPQNHPRRAALIGMFRQLCESVLQQRNDSTHLWYQVINRPGAPGNYLEASGSAMFTYAFAKGARLGVLDPKFAAAARESYNGILRHLVTVDSSRTVYLKDVCRVAGLGGNPYRDGSYEYYVGEPRRTNDFKGYGPFLLAAIEIERQSMKPRSRQ